MALILQLETATTSCSVALALDGKTIALKELNEKNVHASSVTVFIEDVFKESGKSMTELDAVAVSKGPGSYTGLRIGVSTAKGLCYALDKPLISVNTLEAMTSGFIAAGRSDEEALFCPMIDARRMEVYTAVYNSEGAEVSPVEAKIINSESFSELLSSGKMVFFGDGAGKCSEILGLHPNATIITGFVNSSRDLSKPAFRKFLKKEFEDVAYFEPFYLKDFLATQPKKMTASPYALSRVVISVPSSFCRTGV